MKYSLTASIGKLAFKEILYSVFFSSEIFDAARSCASPFFQSFFFESCGA
jgi:hypothetical protein